MKSYLKKVNYALKCNQFFLGDYTQMCSGSFFEHFTLWVELFLNTWQCSVESHNYFTEKNLTGESPGPRKVWWCRQHEDTPLPCIFQHGDQVEGLIKLGFHWGFYLKKKKKRSNSSFLTYMDFMITWSKKFVGINIMIFFPDCL